eukprot:scaffold2639_cov361-Pavlova_lutheri.AAC.24
MHEEGVRHGRAAHARTPVPSMSTAPLGPNERPVWATCLVHVMRVCVARSSIFDPSDGVKPELSFSLGGGPGGKRISSDGYEADPTVERWRAALRRRSGAFPPASTAPNGSPPSVGRVGAPPLLHVAVPGPSVPACPATTSDLASPSRWTVLLGGCKVRSPPRDGHVGPCDARHVEPRYG